MLAACGTSEAEPATTSTISVVPAAVSAVATVVANVASSILPTPTPTTTYWMKCAKEGETCILPVVGMTQVRYGEDGKYAYRDVTGAVGCTNGVFGGDPAPNVVKSCAYASTTPTVPVPVITGKPTAARDRLGINVSSVSYYGGEPTFANQALGVAWLESWQNISGDRLRPDGMPLSVEPGHTLTAILNPPSTVFTGGDTSTRCTWKGTGTFRVGGELSRGGTLGDHRIDFAWAQGKPSRVWLDLASSNAADPVRDLDCRLRSDTPDAVFTSQLINYLKPFGVLRFLDWSSANGNPAAVTWATRAQPRGISVGGSDGIALEYQIALANAVGSSPWFTVAWNADADYHRRMAQMVHDTIPAGKPVYVEVSNEVWNYGFGQAGQAQKEGLDRKLSDNGFAANLARTAQKITEVMPIWAQVYKDRPKDLVRVMATQSANSWVGTQILEWNNSAVIPHIDAIAIAPYFYIDADKLTDNHDNDMTTLAAAAHGQIANASAAYKALADKWGKRLIAYEGGQHLLDPGRLDRMQAMNRDPRMEGIYRQYLTDWNALTGDLFTLYSATGPISQFGAWGLREYAGQPIAETPKLRGVMDYAKQ